MASKYQDGIKSLLDRSPYAKMLVRLLGEKLDKNPKDLYRYFSGHVRWDINHLGEIEDFLVEHNINVPFREIYQHMLKDRNRRSSA